MFFGSQSLTNALTPMGNRALLIVQLAVFNVALGAASDESMFTMNLLILASHAPEIFSSITHEQEEGLFPALKNASLSMLGLMATMRCR